MNVLITGSNGFLGKKLVKIFLEKKAEVIITTRTEQENKNAIKMDITDSENVDAVLKEQKPRVVIHSAAITHVDWCESNREKTFEVNVNGTKNVALGCKKIGAKMVLISTDYVFDGEKKGKYFETDFTNPINVYGQSKLEAEKVTSEILTDFLITRVTAIYGYNDEFDKKTFPTHIIENLSKKTELQCFVDQYLNPTLINDISEGIFSLLKKNQKGIFHMTGRENLNRWEFAKKTAKVFSLNEKLLKQGFWKKSSFAAKRPKKLDISIEKFENQGITMSNAEQGLLKMKKDMETK